MTDLDALLAAVLADPQDDAPRLVYADWHEEYGDAARAEFVRVQVELAKHPRQVEWLHQMPVEQWRGSPDEGRLLVRLDAMRRRERELLHANYMRWTRDLPQMPSHDTGKDHLAPYTFRRGFVAEVTLPTVAWVGGVCPACLQCREMYRNEPGFESLKCHVDCTGRTAAHGPAIMAAHPVECVRVTDLEAWHNASLSFDWWDESYGAVAGPFDKSNLPPEIFYLLAGGRESQTTAQGRSICRGFDTREQADAALSAALIAWAKQVPVEGVNHAGQGE